MPFSDPITAGDILIRDAIRSPNYVAGSAGWSINKDGTAEFASMTMRGIFRTSTGRVHIADQVINIFDPSDSTVAAIGMQPSKFWTGDSILGGVIWGYERVRFAVSPGAPGQVLANTPVRLENGPNRVYDSRHLSVLDQGAAVNPALTTSFQNIITLNFNTINPNAELHIVGALDFNTTVAGVAELLGQLSVDGVADVNRLILDDARNVHHGVSTQTWRKTVAAAGAHSLTLDARKTAAVGTVTAGGGHSALVATLLDGHP